MRHQSAFDVDGIKNALAREVMLAYPNFNEEFEIYCDASKRQLGAVITQNNRPIAFFSRKLSEAQNKYGVTELELLSIVETLKEFKGMLWGQTIKVFTDHKQLVADALGGTSDRITRWRLLLEEYNPEISYIKGADNTVADTINRLEYDPHLKSIDRDLLMYAPDRKNNEEDLQETFSIMVTCLTEYDNTSANETDIANCNMQPSENSTEDEEIYPLTIAEIADVQRSDNVLKKIFKRENYRIQIGSPLKFLMILKY